MILNDWALHSQDHHDVYQVAFKGNFKSPSLETSIPRLRIRMQELGSYLGCEFLGRKDD